MRIKDLLEGRYFDGEKYVRQVGDKKELDYDLVEDLIHFMHNDDNVYRRHLYPAIARCIDSSDQKRKGNPDIFKPAVKHSFEAYAKNFPIRELPNELDKEMFQEVCTKLYDDTMKDITDGKYKD